MPKASSTTTEDLAPSTSGRADAATPLLIDLDRALIRTDLLSEAALAFLTANPRRILHFLAWMLRGRAHLRRRLTEAATPDPKLIPVNGEVVELALEAKRRGRRVFAVTASVDEFACKVAACLPFLDGIISSGGTAELTAPQKAAMVSENLPSVYDYVGASVDDLDVWKNAREIIVVAPDRTTRHAIQVLAKPTTIIEGKSRVRALVKAARPHQWVKNTLVFVPALLSGTIAIPGTAIACVATFLALGLVALGTYLINDLLDIDSDRRHWSKRFRPIAAGDLSIGLAIAAAVVSIVAGLAIGAAVGRAVFASVLVYLALTLAYSIHLKRLPIVDVTVLATLFTLRIAIGISAADVFASPWLLTFSMALFTSLSIAKRYTEIQRATTKGETFVPGRGYTTADAPLLLGLGLATGTASVVILVLFIIFDAMERDIYSNPRWLWTFPGIMFLWIGRIWFISQRGELDDDPVAFAIKDRQSLFLGALSATFFGLALLGLPL